MTSSFPNMPTSDVANDIDPNSASEDADSNELRGLSLTSLLDQDERPTLVLDMEDYAEFARQPIRPVFCNAALRQHHQLLDSVIGGPTDDSGPNKDTTTHDEFQIWATVVRKFNETRNICPITLQYGDLLWTAFTIKRWRIISGHAIFQSSDIPKGDPISASAPRGELENHQGLTPHSARALASAEAIPGQEILPDIQQPKFPPVSLSGDTQKDFPYKISPITLSTPESSVPDWTIANPKGVLPEHLKFVRTINWASTPLGPMEKWSLQFREIICLVMRNPHPTSVFWGKDLNMLYNEAYRDEVTGDKHPALMGTGFSGPFGEMWHEVSPVIREVARTGQGVITHNHPLPIERYGYMEEAFFTWSFVPVFGGTENILGFYCGAFDTTVKSINGRRMALLRYLGECLNATRTVEDFWQRVLDGLQHNIYDVPFALLYSVADSEDADVALNTPGSTTSMKSCALEGSFGIPRGHVASPQKFELKQNQEGFVPAFRDAVSTREPTFLEKGKYPASLLEDVEWGGYGDPCREALIIPLRPTNMENTCALLLIGINPRRAYDTEYQSFTAMLNRQIATSLASVILFEDEVRQSKSAAEIATIQRELLSQQLQLQTSRMRRMTELSPLGMYLFDPQGRVWEANDRYYEMTGTSREDGARPWSREMMADESQEAAQEMWNYMITTRKPTSRELQFRNPKIPPRDVSGEPIEYWVLSSSQPEVTPDGELVSIMGSITDISHLKWAQGLQERRLREAEEAKRQTNEFIDITSHEMRNPLSAILICADDIRDTLTSYEFSGVDQKVAQECIEAAKNIALCAQHQKSIIDDILTVSKLDSSLLRIAPVPTQPVVVVQRAMAMFRPEIEAKKIDLKFHPRDDLHHYDINWLLLDPSRLLQITVNLLTNAIKFTQNAPRRLITVHVCAHNDQPDFDLPKGFEFVPARSNLVEIGTGEGWGSGQRVYLRIEVEDTGCGLTEEEKALLFERFAQASARTHAQYGGSGLGLFISRQLSELHGGQIGVSSKAGVGSTFGFYLQCRRMRPERSTPSDDQIHILPNEAILPRNIHEPSPRHNRAKSSHDQVAAKSAIDKKQSTSGPRNPTQDDKLHVLVVEDNLVNQKVLKKQLTKSGCIVSTADNGVYALEHLAKTHFQVTGGIPLSIILIDWEMPEMDGLQCCRRIREMQKQGELSSHVPVIAVTANIRGEQIATAKEAGMDDVIGKPFKIPDILAKSKALLKRLEEGE
ncbi:putative histidine kinase HHK16p [Clathrospora elynae]|uniref:Putative histidine kinase HHK16p n=1 Tax=Clathrospora elynae TaxID=706981 RepID=A0A6A5T2N2_9PLEO|nr:putative histidine kinase HHK16p [Clathrospora elynae]